MSRHAHTRPHIPLADFATELRDLGLDALDNAHDPSVSLPTVLSWSLRGLTAEQRTVFALVGIAPGPDLGLPAAASLTGLSLRQTSKVLGALEEASLLARRPGGRYAMHDLIRDYATTTADTDLGQDALQRLLDFYTHTAYAADHLLAPHRPAVKLEPPAPGTCPVSLSDDSAAIAWFDREHANLLAAQHIAAARGWHEIVWELAWALPTYQDRRGHRHDRLAVWQAALKAAPYLADPSASSCAHRHLATACATLGRDEDAIEHMRQA